MVYSYTASCMINGLGLFTETKDSSGHDYQNIVTIELDNKTCEKSIMIPPSSKVCSYIISSRILIN